MLQPQKVEATCIDVTAQQNLAFLVKKFILE
jgi:hypothetical protein